MLTYTEACARAQDQSRDGCGRHVNVIITVPADGHEPFIQGYAISDWFDGTTVKSYSDGKELS